MKDSHARATLALASSGLITLVLIACSSSSDGGGGGGTSPVSPIGQDPEPLFRAFQADLINTCGGTNGQCHVKGTYNKAPTWLGDPDPYLSAKKYRGILPATLDVGDSIILTQVQHAGPSLKQFPSLYDRVANWVLAEVGPTPLPNTGAFSITSGLNQVQLNTAGSGLDGASIQFLADDSNGVLTLSAMELVAPNDANVLASAPFFVILPRNGKVNADPADNGFLGDRTFPAGTTTPFFDGNMILLHWDSGGQLKIAFQKLSTSPGTAASIGCTALDVFKSQAIPALSATTLTVIDPDEGDGGSGGGDAGAVLSTNASCVQCHAAASPTGFAVQATKAMDLTAIDTDQAAACAQARIWINFADKTKSTIILNPTGQANPNHPVRTLSASDPIIAGLTAWVTAEHQ